MDGSQRYIGCPNGVVLCVDDIGAGRMKARTYHSYSREAMEVTNMNQFLFGLEDFFNSMRFPFPMVNERTFQDREQAAEIRKGRVKVMSDEELLSKHGYLGTFVIRVQHRQHSSWQGRITWLDKNKTLYFRSVWEMVKMIANALSTVSDDEILEVESWQDE